jgi:hypothetical protein
MEVDVLPAPSLFLPHAGFRKPRDSRVALGIPPLVKTNIGNHGRVAEKPDVRRTHRGQVRSASPAQVEKKLVKIQPVYPLTV